MKRHTHTHTPISHNKHSWQQFISNKIKSSSNGNQIIYSWRRSFFSSRVCVCVQFHFIFIFGITTDGTSPLTKYILTEGISPTYYYARACAHTHTTAPPWVLRWEKSHKRIWSDCSSFVTENNPSKSRIAKLIINLRANEITFRQVNGQHKQNINKANNKNVVWKKREDKLRTFLTVAVVAVAFKTLFLPFIYVFMCHTHTW